MGLAPSPRRGGGLDTGSGSVSVASRPGTITGLGLSFPLCNVEMGAGPPARARGFSEMTLGLGAGSALVVITASGDRTLAPSPQEEV